MKKVHNSELKNLSRKLRKNLTKEERKLWYEFLKGLPVTFYRQKTFGNYIVDFYCASKNLVIELDGSQHYEEEGERSDRMRDEYLASLGFTVLRFSNAEIHNNFRGVCEVILRLLEK